VCASVVRPLVKLTDDSACGSLEEKRQESVNERGTRRHQQTRGKPGGEGHMAEIGFADLCRMRGKDACDRHAGPLQRWFRYEYPDTLRRFIGLKMSLYFAISWDKYPNMAMEIDKIDRKLLAELQRDGTLSVDQLSERVALSRNACWRRVKRMEEEGVITGRVALVDADKLGLGLSVFILVRTSNHDPDWLQKFRAAVTGFPEITGVYRMSGDLDYVLRARVADVKAYDRLYQRLIAKVALSDVSASFVMEEIKETTVVPMEVR